MVGTMEFEKNLKEEIQKRKGIEIFIRIPRDKKVANFLDDPNFLFLLLFFVFFIFILSQTRLSFLVLTVIIVASVTAEFAVR